MEIFAARHVIELGHAGLAADSGPGFPHYSISHGGTTFFPPKHILTHFFLSVFLLNWKCYDYRSGHPVCSDCVNRHFLSVEFFVVLFVRDVAGLSLFRVIYISGVRFTSQLMRRLGSYYRNITLGAVPLEKHFQWAQLLRRQCSQLL
jgi:hypothetical protein